MLTALLILTAWWSLSLVTLWVWKRDLFQRTWKEPYFADTPVLIESDDWGPGGAYHAVRLRGLLECLSRHIDHVGRCAVLTADTVLAVPDMPKIKASRPISYHRRFLDQAFPRIHAEMMRGIKQGTLVPQLHGLEHLNANAILTRYAAGDPKVDTALQEDNWWDWESLDSPLQGHYVDGSRLPTTPIDLDSAEEIIGTATVAFEQMFGYPSISTVAPCYLWNSDIEVIWKKHKIGYIQTAGYRCTERDKHGTYRQYPPIIRAGNKSDAGQRYLVRNVMYEPVDGRNTPDTAFTEAMTARQQALPITISTHRYNFTRSEAECRTALDGLGHLLIRIKQTFHRIRYLSSPELGMCIDYPQQRVDNQFNGETFPAIAGLTDTEKIRPFLYRLKHRHPKLLMLAIMTGLVLPIGLIMLFSPPIAPSRLNH